VKQTAKYFRILFIALAMLSMIGCAMKTDMEAMQSERQNDLNRIKQLESELAESKRQLKEEIDKSNDPLREKSADMWAEIQSLRAQNAQLRGEMDSINIRLDRQVGKSDSSTTVGGLADRLAEVEFALENQLQVDLPKVREERAAALAASSEQPTDGAQAATDATTAVAVATAESTGTKTEKASAATTQKAEETDPAKALYDKASALYKQGDYEKARSYWAEFTATFKKHKFVPSATFWQGQCYYKLKDYARAVILFEDVIEKFPKSSKYKDALLKAGYSWQYLGKPDLAKMRMEEVIKKFPDTKHATLARNTLDKMK